MVLVPHGSAIWLATISSLMLRNAVRRPYRLTMCLDTSSRRCEAAPYRLFNCPRYSLGYRLRRTDSITNGRDRSALLDSLTSKVPFRPVHRFAAHFLLGGRAEES